MTQSLKNSFVAKPEVKLLLCCGTTHVSEAETDEIKSLIQGTLDWGYLLECARRNGLMPLLYRHLAKAGRDDVPPSILERLRNHFYLNARRNSFLGEELKRLVHVFDEQGVSVIPFKGPTLAEELYGDIGCREISDLDVLIKREDVLRALEFMTSLGYTPQCRFSKEQMAAYVSTQNEISFVSEGRKTIVELQWEIAPRYFGFPIAPFDLWNHNQARSRSGFPSLRTEEMLLMLCVHGAKDLWKQLKWICDVAELLRVHKDLDWEKTIGLADDSGARRILFLGLSLAKDILDAPLPEKVVHHIESDPMIRRLANEVWQRLFLGSNTPPGLLETSFFHLKSRERLRDRIQYCFRLMVTTTPRDWAIIKLPRFLSPLYSFFRPLRLIRKYGGGIARQISGKGKGKAQMREPSNSMTH
jgi:hypothetical protein